MTSRNEASAPDADLAPVTLASDGASKLTSRGVEAADAPLHLDDDWKRGPDGMRSRRAARVLILDEAGRVLLVQGHDADEPDRQWWFTIGGGIDEGETAREAARREMFEETGLRVDIDDLQGPVVERSAIFDFARERCRQDEEFFYVRVSADEQLSTAGWTELENNFIDDLAWMTVEELREVSVEVFPKVLPDIVESLANGWDGIVTKLGLIYD